MAAVLANQGGYYRPHAYIAECRRMGLVVDGPDVNTSRWRYYGLGKRVVVGLMAIKGLSHTGAEAIITERERGGVFRSLGDFVHRVRLSRDDVIALCPAGAFDGIARGMPRTLQARELLGSNSGAVIKGQAELFVVESPPRYGGAAVLTRPVAVAPKEGKADHTTLWAEYAALGFLRRLHPLTLWKDKIRGLRRVKARDMAGLAGEWVCLLGWPITQKEVWTRDGLTMSFLTFEDETALYETVIFPKVYDQYSRLLFDQRPLLVYGRVADDNGAVSVEVSKVEVLG
jgi:DNA polymerase-3 subunit alpha/error-prone DNA polymerase